MKGERYAFISVRSACILTSRDDINVVFTPQDQWKLSRSRKTKEWWSNSSARGKRVSPSFSFCSYVYA